MSGADSAKLRLTGTDDPIRSDVAAPEALYNGTVTLIYVSEVYTTVRRVPDLPLSRYPEERQGEDTLVLNEKVPAADPLRVACVVGHRPGNLMNAVRQPRRVHEEIPDRAVRVGVTRKQALNV